MQRDYNLPTTYQLHLFGRSKDGVVIYDSVNKHIYMSDDYYTLRNYRHDEIADLWELFYAMGVHWIEEKGRDYLFKVKL